MQSILNYHSQKIDPLQYIHQLLDFNETEFLHALNGVHKGKSMYAF